MKLRIIIPTVCLDEEGIWAWEAAEVKGVIEAGSLDEAIVMALEYVKGYTVDDVYFDDDSEYIDIELKSNFMPIVTLQYIDEETF